MSRRVVLLSNFISNAFLACPQYFWFEFWPLKYRQLICDDGAALDFYVSIFDSVFSLNSNVHISLVIHAILDQTFDSDPFM